jgi:DNA-binding response OmpR family regulator
LRNGWRRNVRTALIVQHDLPTGELIAQLLRDRGYDTVVASTYAQALALFAATAPRVVIIDPVLTDGDGLALVRSAKSSARVVITSAFPSGVERAAADLGVPLVVKPFETDELIAQIG